MFRREKMVLGFTPMALAAEILSFALLAMILLTASELYESVPDRVPRRYSMAGQAYDWAEKPAALVPAIMATFVYVIATGLGIILRRMSPSDNRKGILASVLMVLLVLKIVYLTHALIRTHAVMSAANMPIFAMYILPVGFTLTIAAGANTIRKKLRT